MFALPVRQGIKGFRGVKGFGDVVASGTPLNEYSVCVAASPTQTMGGTGACDGLTGDPKNYTIMGYEMKPMTFYMVAAGVAFLAFKFLKR